MGAPALALGLGSGGVRAADPPGPGRVLTCQPSVRELQTRRPLPVQCQAEDEAVRMTLRYRERGTEQWTTLEMQRYGAFFRAQIPCAATMNAGALDLFVVATDSEGDPLDTFGTKAQPESFRIDGRSRVAPAFPGERAPARCAEQIHCPPDFPGCDQGLADGDLPEQEGEPEPIRHWLGLHVAADVGFIGGTDVCAARNQDFDCFSAGGEAPYPARLAPELARDPGELGDVYPGSGIDNGASSGTWRALLSYEHVLSERLSVGGRLGYAFGGGPTTLSGKSFLPLHAEGRLSYWLRPTHARGVRAYVHLGGGIAQVDLKKSDITVRDCSEEAVRSDFLSCIAAEGAYDSANSPELPERRLDAYRKLGNAFVTSGGGVLVGLTHNTALQVHLNAMLLLPSVGVVVEPSLGVLYGF